MRDAQGYLDDLLRMQEDAKRRVQTQEQRAREAVERMNGSEAANVGKSFPPERRPEGEALSAAADAAQTERMFILALCMLLSAEGADDALILSLMYLAS